jgi:hypothetical protein
VSTLFLSGMIAQETFTNQCTHFITNTNEGMKFKAAIQWKLPVVTVKWLLACLKAKLWVSEGPFLVRFATKVTTGKPEPVRIFLFYFQEFGIIFTIEYIERTIKF